MSFLDSIFKRRSSKDEVFAGLFLKEVEGTLVFMKIVADGYKILTKKKFTYSNGWENIVEDIDQAIFKLETETKQSPKRAIFFIYSHLVDKKTREIKAPYIDQIKLISKNLEIAPLGYIEYHEAVVEHFNKKEASPLTAVLIEFDKSDLGVFVYRAGKLVFEDSIARTDNLIEDLIPTFEKVRAHVVIPSRIILYDSSDLDTASSKLVTHKWKEDFFVHIPKVQVIHEGELIESLISVFISQISKESSAHLTPRSDQEEQREEAKKEVLGFTIGADPGDAPPEEKVVTPSEPPVLHESVKKKAAYLNMDNISKKIDTFKARFRIPPGIKKGYLLLAIGGLLLIISILVTEYFFHTATITVFFPSKSVDKKLTIKDLDLTIATDSAEFKEDKTTTGKKETGEKAKGTITIFNSSIQDGKNFAKGLAVKAPNGLEFGLDSDVKVASASGDASSLTPSTAKVQVTAGNIGTEYNLGKDTKFSVGGESAGVVIAKNESAFSGGSKKQVQTVSRQDIDDIEEEVIDESKKYLTTKIEPKLKKGDKIVASLTEITPQKSEFSSELGEETDSLSIESTVDITYFSYSEEELVKQISGKFNKEKGSDMVIENKNIKYKINKVGNDGKDATFDVSSTVKLTQNVNEKQVLSSAVAKNTKSLEELLKDKYKAQGLELTIKHPIGFLKNWTPPFRKNISLKIIYL